MPEMRVTFHEELDALCAEVQKEGDLVLRSLRASLNALETDDVELAGEVISFDDEIDQLYADDLRLVLALLHINLHLERMGDYCVTIAKLLRLAEGLPGQPRMTEQLEEMGERCEEMIRVAMLSFAERDIDAASSLVELDELIDRVNRRAVNRILDLAGDPSAHEWGLRMLLVYRCLERIGDHAVDIGEQTAYLVSGEFREFTDASRPQGALS